jgi:hypothetical protein
LSALPNRWISVTAPVCAVFRVNPALFIRRADMARSTIPSTRPISSGRLAKHYVHGKGELLSINPEVYKSSVIVKDTITLMKRYIVELIESKKPYQHITSGEIGFRSSSYFSNLRLYKRNTKPWDMLIAAVCYMRNKKTNVCKKAIIDFNWNVSIL